ncbi:MAG: hypothetical protein SV966_12860 [Actinomycetota bacterium]|nr:hypothetical protein [Actinomycetota bacterium]
MSVPISDTGLLIEELDEIPRRFPGIDAGILHLGGTRSMSALCVPMWSMMDD